MIFDPVKPAAEMSAAELMAAHIAMGDPKMSPEKVAKMTACIYDELNRQFGCKQDEDEDEASS